MTSGNSNNSIVILGASCRAAAQRAAKAGYQPHAFDLFADRDLIECAQTGQLDTLGGSENQWRDPCWNETPMLLAGGMEHRPELVDRLRSHDLQCGVTGWMLRELRSIANWQSWALSTGIGFPETRFSRPSRIQQKDQRRESNDEQWLRKRTNGAGGIGLRIESHSSHTANDDEPQHYWQRRLDGIPIGVSFLSDAVRNHTLGAVLSLSQEDIWGPEPYSYRGSIGPVALPSVVLNQLDRFGNVVRCEVGHRGLWQADFILSDGRLSLLEINPRWSSSMELLDAIGQMSNPSLEVIDALNNFVEWHVQSLGESPIPIHRNREFGSSTTSFMIGKCIIYAQCDLRLDEGLLDSWWNQRWQGSVQELDFGVRYADIPPIGSAIERGYPILSCFATGESRGSIVEQLRNAADNISKSH
ncbi:MAG: ATP-grasp domain-containing protein [Planctomycetes bacterium]|nr:ATP-grasp domain-containing protein [Planctomycetota bacterium]